MYEFGREGARRPPTCWLRGRRSNPQMWASLKRGNEHHLATNCDGLQAKGSSSHVSPS